MRQTPLISSFKAGALSPRLWGQSDEPVYYQGASIMQNLTPMPQGGFYKRPGTLVCGHTFGDASARFIPFIISTSTAYVLEFTNNLIRVWKNGVLGASIVTTYTTAEIPDIQVFPFFPDLFICHQAHAPARLRWTTPNTLTLGTLTFKTSTITTVTNTAGAVVALTGDVTSGSLTIINVPGNLIPAESIWLISGTGIPASTYITSVVKTAGSSPVTYTVTLSQAASATNAGVALTMTLQPLVFQSSATYPRAVTIAYQRLWFAGTTTDPQKYWQSIVGIWDASDPTGASGIVGMAWSDLTAFSVPILQINADGSPTTNPPVYLPTPQITDQVNDADAGGYTINAERDDEIYWMFPDRDMVLGTSSGEWIVPATGNPNAMEARKVSFVTDSAVMPTKVNGGMVFIQRLGHRVFKLNWQGQNNPFEDPPDMTFFAEHLFATNAATAMAAQATPDCLIWCLRTDGTLAVLVYNAAAGVMAWWEWITNGVVNGLCVVPGTDFQGVADRDIVYMNVTRGASTYVECVATPFWTSSASAIYSDCATYKSAASFKTMAIDTGLNGTTLEVVADGAYIGTAVVSGGSLTLPGGKSATKAVAGLNFTSLMTTMPLVPPTQEGTGQLKKKSIPRARFRVLNSLYMLAGQFTTPAAAMQKVKLGDSGVDYTAASPTLYSGYARASVLEALRDDGFVSVKSDLPLPLTVTAIVPDVVEVE